MSEQATTMKPAQAAGFVPSPEQIAARRAARAAEVQVEQPKQTAPTAPTAQAAKPSQTARPARPVTVVPMDLKALRGVVIRHIPGSALESGQVVELPNPRRAEMLKRDRRLRDLQYGEEIYRCSCGRMWVGKDIAAAH